jgi:hypothetical protein
VACLANADCTPAAPTCHAGACVECVHPHDCPGGQTCTNGTCH